MGMERINTEAQDLALGGEQKGRSWCGHRTGGSSTSQYYAASRAPINTHPWGMNPHVCIAIRALYGWVRARL